MKKYLWITLTILILSACGNEPATITVEEFNQLHEGMTIDEIQDIVGGDPKQIDEDLGNYIYGGEDGVEKDATVTLAFSDKEKLLYKDHDGFLNKRLEETPTTEESTDTTVEEEPASDLNYDITTGIEDKLGKTNTDKERIVKLEVNDHMGTDNGEDKIVLVTLRGNENLSDSMTKKGILMDTTDVFKILFDSRIVEEATVFWHLPLVDKKGNESEENVLEITLNKKTFDEINLKNFDYNNFKTVADGYEEHPALK